MTLLQSGLAKSLAEDYTIDNSLRFEDGDSAYLTKTDYGAGNRTSWTWSGWAKFSQTDTQPVLFSWQVDGSPNNRTALTLGNQDINFANYIGSYDASIVTDAKYRDPSAWYHVVAVWDTDNGTPGDRLRLYVNGERVTSLGTETYPSSGTNSVLGNSSGHFDIGQQGDNSQYMDGYLAEVYFIDGQSLAADSFGELDSTTNQWIPKDASGLTFGTNGFYQKYAATELADSFEDSAPHTPHTVTANGDAHTDTSVKKIGTASAQFGGAGELEMANSSDFNFGTGNFTVEFWARFGDISTNNQQFIFKRNVTYTGDYVLWWSSSNGMTFTSGSGGSGTNVNQGGTSGWANDTWYHVALVRSGTSLNVYRDGVSIISVTNSIDFDNTGNLFIGSSDGSGYFTGYMDEFRISNIARYVGAFTPSTTAFNSDQYTKLLLHCDGADDGTTFTDSADSAPAHTITANGDVTNTRAVRKIGDSSIIFDGTGDYLSVPSSSDFALEASDFTVEMWMNPDDMDGNKTIYDVRAPSENGPYMYFSDTETLYVNNGAGGEISTDMDVGTWYHVAYVRDGEVIRLYKDGVQVGSATESTFSDTTDRSVVIGRSQSYSDYYYKGYVDEVRISNSCRYPDGTTFTTFGQDGGTIASPTPFTADANTKLLIHSNWDGGLGADSSGNYNTFTPTNLVATDQMIDTPTNNWCTYNPLAPMWGTIGNSPTLSEGNLKLVTSSGWRGARSTFVVPKTGKFYAEFLADGASTGSARVFGLTPGNQDSYTDTGVYAWFSDNSTIRYSNVDLTNSSTAVVTGDIAAIYVNDGEVKLYRNNTLEYTFTTNLSAVDDDYFFYGMSAGTTAEVNANFGQDSSFSGEKTAQNNDDSGDATADWYYAPPAGVESLCTDNLSDPEIALPGEYFNTVLYTGDGAADHEITGVGFQPDFSWVKMRSSTGQHMLFDAIRGAGQYLVSNNNEEDKTDASSLLSFDSDGISVGSGYHVNSNTATFANWNWKAGGAPTADNDNTSGAMDANSVALNGSLQASYTPEGSPSIYPTKMSINTTAGFSIIEYDGNSTAGATLPHGLTQAPDITFVKELTYVDNWVSFAEPLGNTKALFLDQDNAAGTHTTYWNDTSPSSTVITLGTDGKANSSRPHIMYAFHSVEGYSKVGSYTGNANADGPFVYTGFKPAMVIIKQTTTANWFIFDDARDTYNVVEDTLKPSTNDAETDVDTLDFVSNGFKLRNNSGTSSTNDSGVSILYLAFAESPFKTSNAR